MHRRLGMGLSTAMAVALAAPAWAREAPVPAATPDVAVAPATATTASVEPPPGMAMVEVDGRVVMEPVAPEGGEPPAANPGPGAARAEELLSGDTLGGMYSNLAPYGDWYISEIYGAVWRPSPAAVGPMFTPFVSGGHWVHTNDGYSFESVWDWGGVVFHYGTWVRDPDLGWAWLPSPVRVLFGASAVAGAAPPPSSLRVRRIIHPAGIEIASMMAPAAWSPETPPAYQAPRWPSSSNETSPAPLPTHAAGPPVPAPRFGMGGWARPGMPPRGGPAPYVVPRANPALVNTVRR